LIKNIIITGGFGFIGLNLIKTILSNPVYKILVIDNLSVGSIDDFNKVLPNQKINRISGRSDWKNQISYVVGDITNKKMLFDFFKEADCVIHLAANTGVGPSVDNPHEDFMANAYGTFVCLELARIHGIKRFVYASSGAPLGEQTPPLNEQMAPRPASPYGASKLCGEGYCSAYSYSYDIETVCLRFSNVYGPTSQKKNSLVAKLIKKMLKFEEINIYGNGEQTRDFIFIQDLVDAIQAAMISKLPKTHELLQIATGHETSVNTIIFHLTRIAIKNQINMPKVNYVDRRVGDVMRNYSDIRHAKYILNWEPRMNLESGLANTMDYFLTGEI